MHMLLISLAQKVAQCNDAEIRSIARIIIL